MKSIAVFIAAALVFAAAPSPARAGDPPRLDAGANFTLPLTCGSRSLKLGPVDPTDPWANRIVEEIETGSPPCNGGPTSVPWDELAVESVMTSAVPVVAPHYAWPLLDERLAIVRGIWSQLGQPGCKYTPPDGAKPNAAPVTCKVVSDGDGTRHIRFSQPDVLDGEVELSGTAAGKKKTKWTLKAPIAACKYVLAGVVVAGAIEQRVAVKPLSSSADCDHGLAGVTSLRIDDHEIAAERDTFDRAVLVLHGVPADVPPGKRDGVLSGGDGAIASVELRVAPPIRAASAGEVHYDVTDDAWSAYFDVASGDARKEKLSDGSEAIIAVVDPTKQGAKAKGKRHFAVYNVVELAVPDALAAAPPAEKKEETKKDAQKDKAQEGDPASNGETEDCWFHALGEAEVDHWELELPPSMKRCREENGSCVAAGDDPLSSLRRLAFAMTRATPFPIVVRAHLYTRTKESKSCLDRDTGEVDDVSGWRSDRALTVAVVLAHSAREESVAIPASAMWIQCDGEKVRDEEKVHDGQTWAIDDDAIRKGACTIRIGTGWSRNIKRLFGLQRLEVKVERDGTKGAVAFRTTGLGEGKGVLPIPSPSDADDGRGAYRVSVRAAASSRDSKVFYRNMDLTADALANGDHNRAELHFEARLRPRGLFGFRCQQCVRVYATASTTLTGIRLPANPALMSSSTDPVAYQIVTPQLGLLGVVEPWNYRDAEPLVPLAFAHGLTFVRIGEGSTRITSLAGFQLQVPVIRDATGQLGATLGVGLFWENDLRGHNAGLVALNFNLGSLLSPPTER